MLQRLPAPACIWMQAGVIRFWLCDRDYDCQNCPLDAALRAPRQVPRELAAVGSDPPDPVPHGPHNAPKDR